jgi:alkylated DNA repair protein (DNA oxidative demethylase)
LRIPTHDTGARPTGAAQPRRTLCVRRPLRSFRRRPAGSIPEGQHYDPRFVAAKDRARIVEWLSLLHPIWEQRFSTRRPPPQGQEQRYLLRPVYWLGNWQFACLDYYRPPHGIHGRCVRAEPFPDVLAELVSRIEERARSMFRGADLPARWHLNTCLVNFYGSRGSADTARVGEHRDFEPGPVASVSLGERALFQFVKSSRPGDRDEVVSQTWLADSSLQIFGGERWKRQHFHRVQRVTDEGTRFELRIPETPTGERFETRRVNFTFRYVPDEHVIAFRELPEEARLDVRAYVEELARNSPFWAQALRDGD